MPPLITRTQKENEHTTQKRHTCRRQVARLLDAEHALPVHANCQQNLRGHRVPPHWTQQRLDDLRCVENRFGSVGREGCDVVGHEDS